MCIRDSPNFNPYLDPKCNWAVQHYGLFPVDVNREMCIRDRPCSARAR